MLNTTDHIIAYDVKQTFPDPYDSSKTEQGWTYEGYCSIQSLLRYMKVQQTKDQAKKTFS